MEKQEKPNIKQLTYNKQIKIWKNKKNKKYAQTNKTNKQAE